MPTRQQQLSSKNHDVTDSCTLSFKVSNPKGLHARPCSEIARCASRFRSQILLRFDGKCVEAKSILGLLTLAVGCGCIVEVIATGSDSTQAAQAISTLAGQQFGLEY